MLAVNSAGATRIKAKDAAYGGNVYFGRCWMEKARMRYPKHSTSGCQQKHSRTWAMASTYSIRLPRMR